jgi:hypothetical protein|tara:strand:+ start:52 stop:537 length:486 start_codon:yes stop_codon:yes gene_type:complete
MTKKLEDLLNLAPVDEVVQEVSEEQDIIPVPDTENYQNAMSKADKIDAALPMVENLESSDIEMDEIADTAKDTFKDLMDLGMNVEARYAGDIFSTAARMLDTALNAKGAKIDRKLKMIDLQLKKARIDQVQAKHDGGTESDGDAVVLDRNALLEKLMKNDK